MKKTLFCMIGILIGIIMSGCSHQVTFFTDQNLDGWKPVLSDASVDPTNVWSVDDGILRCEGKPSGYIRTMDAYENYKLHIEWRWPEKPTNSGVLLHLSELDQVWPKSIEAQLKHTNAGDFYVIGGADFAEPKEGRRLQKKHDSNEKEPGQWNSYDIICQDNTITLYVNGLLQNKATETTVNSGMIALQSEGSPIEFRNMRLTPLK